MIKELERFLIWLEIFFMEEYYIHGLPNNPKILDCGGHFGLFTKFYKRKYPNAQITVVEANPKTFETLEANLAQESDVTLINKAITTDSETFISDFKFSMGNKIGPKGKFKVAGVSLLQLMERNEFNLIKLDIEESEYEAIKHARGKLTNCDAYLIELHNIRNRKKDIDDVIKFFKDNSYTVRFKIVGLPINERLINMFSNAVVLIAQK